MQQFIQAHYSDHWLVTRHDADEPGGGHDDDDDEEEEDQGWPSSAGFIMRRKRLA